MIRRSNETDLYTCSVCLECPSSTYNNNNSIPICSDCPFGAICPGGSVVLAQQFFWQDSASYTSGNTPQIYACPKELNTCCQDPNGCSIEEQCKNGTTGALCSKCSDSDSFIWQSTCVPCKTATVGYFVGLFSIAVIISAIILVSPRFHGVFISNLIFAYQVISLVVSVSLDVLYIYNIIFIIRYLFARMVQSVIL